MSDGPLWPPPEEGRDYLRPGGIDPAWIDAIRRARDRLDAAEARAR